LISYAMSMIPGWERALDLALHSLAPGGSLHIVDFGQQERLPRWFRTLLREWLARFHVSPRANLRAELANQAKSAGMRLEFTPLYRGYAVHAVVQAPSFSQ
jgi:S-adenosylmethionine-diacylgycerolhomoserine-N-methlytransferase